MKEELVTFETAKQAKEKGFIEDCFYHFSKNGTLNENSVSNKNHVATHHLYANNIDFELDRWGGGDPDCIAVPTQSFLQKWLWVNYSIWIEITLWGDGIGFICLIKQVKGKEKEGSSIVRQISIVESGMNLNLRDDPYMLLEKGLQKALKLIKLK